ncbi:hypothetical protein HanXRQr2_Chr16g0772901 [Helianthus annuus]|uniref:Uncharacterized protein n=1 Tax=Helianthus annuus TaxID=4232 RepID=A0A9K3H015_HELAN|nr:hypothetical protein HanXRQr2_Chr16g0772901 [Helianthus annuus]
MYSSSSSENGIEAWGQWIHSKYGSSKSSGKQSPWSMGMSSTSLNLVPSSLLSFLTKRFPACRSVLKIRISNIPMR